MVLGYFILFLLLGCILKAIAPTNTPIFFVVCIGCAGQFLAGTLLAQSQNAFIPKPTQKELATAHRWNINVSAGVAQFQETDDIIERAAAIGYADSLNNLFRANSFPFTTKHSTLLLANVSYNIHTHFKVGVQWSHTFQKVKLFNRLYTEYIGSSWSFTFPRGRGHKITTRVQTHLFEPFVAVVLPGHFWSVSGGPSFAFIKEQGVSGSHQKTGFWVGSGLSYVFPKHPHTKLSFNVSYHHVPDHRLQAAYYSTTDEDGNFYESYFEGIDLPLSYLRIGFGVGWLF